MELYPPTALGGKKDLSLPMASTYLPTAVETSWYEWWTKAGFFKPEYRDHHPTENSKETFVIPAPPPNITGSLHIGHALTAAIQDALIRWYVGDITEQVTHTHIIDCRF